MHLHVKFVVVTSPVCPVRLRCIVNVQFVSLHICVNESKHAMSWSLAWTVSCLKCIQTTIYRFMQCVTVSNINYIIISFVTNRSRYYLYTKYDELPSDLQTLSMYGGWVLRTLYRNSIAHIIVSECYINRGVEQPCVGNRHISGYI